MTSQRVSKAELLKALQNAEASVENRNVRHDAANKLCFLAGWFTQAHPDLARALRRAAGQEAE
ncbi:hypothetical protein [Pandoraea sputorum]|uniref:hypothetical protein n=1 Tax=Pandoraea sputorum TaxID=93222 RepID=UPI002F9139BC